MTIMSVNTSLVCLKISLVTNILGHFENQHFQVSLRPLCGNYLLEAAVRVIKVTYWYTDKGLSSNTFQYDKRFVREYLWNYLQSLPGI